jgi:hypothetical protein
MCWLTLSPAKGKKHQYDQSSSDSSCVEELVRVHRSPSRPRFTEVKVKVPSSISVDMSDHHHHHHLHPHLDHHHRHHLHPLHLHPIHDHHGHRLHHHHHGRTVERIHGPGRRRCSPPPSPPPPTRDSSRCRPKSPSPSPRRPREPIYRTQIVEPREVRETTRVALTTTESDRQRGRLRRVAGYEVLGSQVPFDWDCISSTAGGGSIAGGRWVRRKMKRSNLKYPPFGTVDRWM